MNDRIGGVGGAIVDRVAGRWVRHDRGAVLERRTAIASFMREAADSREMTVAVLCEPRHEVLAIAAAADDVGANVIVLDPRAPAESTECRLRSARPRFVFCQYPEQADVIARIIQTELIVIEPPFGRYAGLCDVVRSAPIDESSPSPIDQPKSAGIEIKDDDIVVVGTGLDDCRVRGLIWSIVRERATVVLATSERVTAASRAFRPDGLVVAGVDLDHELSSMRKRQPPTVLFREALIVGLPAICMWLWFFATLAGISTTDRRTTVAIASAAIVAAIVAAIAPSGLRGSSGGRGHLVIAIAGLSASALRLGDLAPSARAALEFTIIVVALIQLLRSGFQWLTSAAWRYGAGLDSDRNPPSASSRAQLFRRRLAGSLCRSSISAQLGLSSCRWVITHGTAGEDATQEFSGPKVFVRVDELTSHPQKAEPWTR